ncbi:hypothetical protein L2E82_44058 [Cichorium intybus]|uniref:Uncharacterized protein n=1 Tax=Cichorium intybus TaxID=13427 RepID=A0ACB8ZPK4_CICIN|nr:hypothetical protein L2E82_44058 [Cichorium intybus]
MFPDFPSRDSANAASSVCHRLPLLHQPLPLAFAKKYLGKANNKKQTLLVKTKSDVKWSVKYVKIDDKYYFMDGWLKFMNDNRLQMGDFLVFWLRSPSPNLLFQVFFFAPSGCLKHPISSSGAGDVIKPFVNEENSNDEDDDLLGTVQKLLRRVLRTSYLNRMPLSNGFCNTTGIGVDGSVWLRNDDGKMWKVEVTKYGQKSPLLLARGWSDFRKDNKMKLQDIFEISHVKSNLLHIHVIKKSRKGEPSTRN